MRRLPLAYHCRRDWGTLRPLGRDRHCDGCATRVYDLSQRTALEAAALLTLFARSGLCVRYVAGPDGAPRFRAAVRPAPRTSGSLAAAALGVAAVAGCGAASSPARQPPVAATYGVADASDGGDGNADSDGDGIADARDDCPAAAEDRDGFQDDDGCPDPDNDRDRVADAVDRCPDEPETYNGVDDEDGCPDRPLGVVVENAALTIQQHVEFARGSARITAASFALLDELARLIVSHTELRRINVEGHASADEGDAQARSRLATARARAAVDALVARGVEHGRLSAVGVGGATAGSAATPEARASGRRVDFVITERNEGCSAAP